MRKKSKGVIVNISSVVGRVGLPFAGIYESSKFSAEGFSESLFFELEQLCIRVKMIESGSSPTNFGNAKENTSNEVEDYNQSLAKFFENYPRKQHIAKLMHLMMLLKKFTPQ